MRAAGPLKGRIERQPRAESSILVSSHAAAQAQRMSPPANLKWRASVLSVPLATATVAPVDADGGGEGSEYAQSAQARTQGRHLDTEGTMAMGCHALW